VKNWGSSVAAEAKYRLIKVIIKVNHHESFISYLSTDYQNWYDIVWEILDHTDFRIASQCKKMKGRKSKTGYINIPKHLTYKPNCMG
jgi:hypothetical protein